MVLPQGTSAAVVAFGLSLSAGADDLQQRIDAAAPGSTVDVGPGEYAGPLVIDRPLSLVGCGFPRIDGRGVGNVISIRADDVMVRGFVIANSGVNLTADNAGIHVTGDRATIDGNRIIDVLHGVYLKKVTDCRLVNNRIRGKTTLPPPARPDSEAIVSDSPELCSVLNINSRGNGIHLWNCKNCVLDRNTITETRDGMYFSFSDHIEVRGNTVRGVRYGLHYMYSDNNTFVGNVFSDNAAGAAIMYSKDLLVRGNRCVENRGFRAYGLLLNSVDTTRIEDNTLNGNTVGIYLENNNGNILTGNAIERNYIGVRMTASSNDNVFSRNAFAHNMHAAELAGGQSGSNHWSLEGVGNRWQRSEPIDLNGDGIGELPHFEVDLLGGLRRPAPLVGLLSGSPGLEVLQFAYRHIPSPRARGIEDPFPLTPGFRMP